VLLGQSLLINRCSWGTDLKCRHPHVSMTESKTSKWAGAKSESKILDSVHLRKEIGDNSRFGRFSNCNCCWITEITSLTENTHALIVHKGYRMGVIIFLGWKCRKLFWINLTVYVYMFYCCWSTQNNFLRRNWIEEICSYIIFNLGRSGVD